MAQLVTSHNSPQVNLKEVSNSAEPALPCLEQDKILHLKPLQGEGQLDKTFTTTKLVLLPSLTASSCFVKSAQLHCDTYHSVFGLYQSVFGLYACSLVIVHFLK